MICTVLRVIKSRIMKWLGHVVCMGEITGVYRDLVGKPEGKKHLGDLGVNGRIILKKYLQEVGCVCMDWIDLARDWDRWRTLVNAVMNIWVP